MKEKQGKEILLEMRVDSFKSFEKNCKSFDVFNIYTLLRS
jgi:hypothetical protein